VQEKGKTINKCTVINYIFQPNKWDYKEAEANDGSWLGEIRGKAAVDNILFSATDEGIVRMKAENDCIYEDTVYPDTEPFVHAGCYLFIDQNGLYSINRNSITHLNMK